MELSFATVNRAVLNEQVFFERTMVEKPKENRCQAPVFWMCKKTNALTRKKCADLFHSIRYNKNTNKEEAPE